jgi:hypothetical protein
MFGVNQMKMVQDLMSNSGLDLGKVFGLFTGKADGKTIAQTLTPILIKLSPTVGNAIRYLKEKHSKDVFPIISLEETDDSKEIEVITFCTLNEHGQMEPLEDSIPLYQLATYIVNLLDQDKESKNLQN